MRTVQMTDRMLSVLSGTLLASDGSDPDTLTTLIAEALECSGVGYKPALTQPTPKPIRVLHYQEHNGGASFWSTPMLAGETRILGGSAGKWRGDASHRPTGPVALPTRLDHAPQWVGVAFGWPTIDRVALIEDRFSISEEHALAFGTGSARPSMRSRKTRPALLMSRAMRLIVERIKAGKRRFADWVKRDGFLHPAPIGNLGESGVAVRPAPRTGVYTPRERLAATRKSIMAHLIVSGQMGILLPTDVVRATPAIGVPQAAKLLGKLNRKPAPVRLTEPKGALGQALHALVQRKPRALSAAIQLFPVTAQGKARPVLMAVEARKTTVEKATVELSALMGG